MEGIVEEVEIDVACNQNPANINTVKPATTTLSIGTVSLL